MPMRVVDVQGLERLFRQWVADRAAVSGASFTYSPTHHADAPMAEFFADHGYDEAVWMDKARVCMLTACNKYRLPDRLHDAIHAKPHTYAALDQRLKELR